ncbi:FAD/NAD-P-binding domain-containing protein [Mycena sanguinolenta]|uniref:FAD/NAD-P-binding domain-containing protein n=1 Tax=Mycena sanguinolenta TaxID=230812 RepID=A0A8H6YFJ6_9AGAR|nr:FAD/NAD-P-binding domain-containing protein [Mycena sanguinolenta]
MLNSVAVLGAGAAGLVTASTLLADGFDVLVITRDRSPGGQWAKERIYPGLQLNNVHGEFRFSGHEMSVPADASTTGGRLSGQDMRKYMQEYADKFLTGKILFETEILNVRRHLDEDTSSWIISTKNHSTGACDILHFSKIVLCTGGTSKPMIPDYLSATAAQNVGFKGPIIHSAHFAKRLEDILSTIPQTSSEFPRSIVVVGGGKSAQDICAHLASEGRQVTIIYEKTDAFTAGAHPLPDFMRKSRMLSIISPHITLRSRLERFLHTTWIGSKIVHGNWDGIISGSFKAMDIPEDSPLRLTYSPFWNIHTNDEGIPRENGFHAQVNNGKIAVIAPARMTGYGPDGDSVLLNNGQSIKADLVILATGYTSSWGDVFDENTATDIGLHRHPLVYDKNFPDEWANYKSLSNPPPLHDENKRWSSSIYKGMVPAKNILRRDFAINGAVLATNDGYSFEVAAHWISSYFLGDKMKLPKTPEEALEHTERVARWLRKRHPDLNLSLNGACTSDSVFWTWPQHSDELLEDMYLPSLRSGGNFFTWPFQVISITELATLHEEREALRRKNV